MEAAGVAAEPPKRSVGRRLADLFYGHRSLQVGSLLAGPIGWLVIGYLGSLAILLIASFWSVNALSGELVTPAADQYSLATIAYFLLTGCLPYLAKTPREMFTQLLSQPPIALNKARPNLQFGPQVEAVIMRGLAKQPTDRYPDVITFATELRKALLSTSVDDGGFLAKMKGLFRPK